MEEMEPPRETFQLVRGDFRHKGELVTADTPAFLPPIRKTVVENKGGKLQWATDRSESVLGKSVESGFAGFGVPPSGGSTARPPEAGTPNGTLQTGSERVRALADAPSKVRPRADVVAAGTNAASPCDESKAASVAVPSGSAPAKHAPEKPVPLNRLDLAVWLVSPEHPLTPRVTVNRYWALFFGAGLVKTINDFGSQGEWPTHPELLDWLACQFRDGGQAGSRAVGRWDVKALVRLIVTSATYRQSAAVTPEKLEQDSYNRLLSRGPRLQLDAEFVRDNALAISGLLNRKIGGPSVKPYQPAGIWDGTDSKYEQDHGDALYRRGMYVFWRRSAHYPPFATFDAPNREVCTFMRQRTQTPLQSLVLMNDPGFVESAAALAERVLREEPIDLPKRLTRAFRHTLARVPQPDELATLQRAYEQQLTHFRSDPKAAESLLGVGESKRSEAVDKVELAALTAVANVLLNLNETITK
jgi:Protein of unknown function (DUF1553)